MTTVLERILLFSRLHWRIRIILFRLNNKHIESNLIIKVLLFVQFLLNTDWVLSNLKSNTYAKLYSKKNPKKYEFIKFYPFGLNLKVHSCLHANEWKAWLRYIYKYLFWHPLGCNARIFWIPLLRSEFCWDLYLIPIFDGDF